VAAAAQHVVRSVDVLQEFPRVALERGRHLPDGAGLREAAAGFEQRNVRHPSKAELFVDLLLLDLFPFADPFEVFADRCHVVSIGRQH
jgi:hypothetical protein